MQQSTIQMKRLAFTLVAFGFMGVFALAATQPASARQGADDTTTQTTTEQESEAEAEVQSESDSTDDSTGREAVRLRVNQLREDAKKDLEKKRDGRKEMAGEKRKLVCENKQKAIENKLAAFNQAADKHLAKLDDVYKRIQAYKAAENLQPANYDDLIAAATAKQEAATAAVAALKEVAVGVDCSDPETVVKLSAVREAAKATRTALHDYRKALKDIVVALAQSKDDAENGDDTTSGSGSDTTSDTTGGTN